MTVPNGSAKVRSRKKVPEPPRHDPNFFPQGNTFLFTSESVGEGHPDKIWYVYVSFLFFKLRFGRSVYLRHMKA